MFKDDRSLKSQYAGNNKTRCNMECSILFLNFLSVYKSFYFCASSETRKSAIVIGWTSYFLIYLSFDGDWFLWRTFDHLSTFYFINDYIFNDYACTYLFLQLIIIMQYINNNNKSFHYIFDQKWDYGVYVTLTYLVLYIHLPYPNQKIVQVNHYRLILLKFSVIYVTLKSIISVILATFDPCYP